MKLMAATVLRSFQARPAIAATLILFSVLSHSAALADYLTGLSAFEGGDYRKAVEEWRAAAERGHALAQFRLGRLYEEGRGVPQVYVEAHRWYNLAGAQGVEQARKARDAVAAKMTMGELAQARAMAAASESLETVSSVPYLPPAKGTVIDYDEWRCIAENVRDLQYLCGDAAGNHLYFFGHFIAFGAMPVSGYGSRPLTIECSSGSSAPESGSYTIDHVRLDRDAKRAVASLWPLTPGKTATFNLELILTRSDQATVVEKTAYRMTVNGPENATIGGKIRTIWEVEGKTDWLNCGSLSGLTPGYSEKWWYRPDVNAVVRYESATEWGRRSYSLKSIRSPAARR